MRQSFCKPSMNDPPTQISTPEGQYRKDKYRKGASRLTFFGAGIKLSNRKLETI